MASTRPLRAAQLEAQLEALGAASWDWVVGQRQVLGAKTVWCCKTHNNDWGRAGRRTRWLRF